MRPTRKKRHTSWNGYVQRREPNSRSSSREPKGWQYDINMNKEIEIEMRKDRADRWREKEREREGERERRRGRVARRRRVRPGGWGGQWEQPYARFACKPAQGRLSFIFKMATLAGGGWSSPTSVRESEMSWYIVESRRGMDGWMMG
ncbi:hypothetical protein ASPSYDRAFT_756990 [Aspergillus sydowii CBS 593.65]|uniref:Uncharacterized protein n=1 Tax=Aspergillus sydowii CBS 593.65 TaxID=1036612 RepID=A0A1L9TN30_9EURO|nr:uncharacterized protein ASPSYDRAFT_756990 [Aspergillus sydowii CBS 593.65]OJJ60703.1 hypothetical protein ASPSYDRAFT_756990 [Aspergillus sydowii CBS 593.65]